MEEKLLVNFGSDRIASRQIDELIGLARGLLADGIVNQKEIEFLEKWLAAHLSVSAQPVFQVLYRRIREILSDGHVDDEEKLEVFETLSSLAGGDFELGEALKATTLPLCTPAPKLTFAGQTYCFTGTFNFGQRKHCEQAVTDRGGRAGSLTRATNVLVIGTYATDSWKHSSLGHKIQTACDYRNKGLPIAIVSEEHWVSHL
jgi:NAD-dependent DNA ligase